VDRRHDRTASPSGGAAVIEPIDPEILAGQELALEALTLMVVGEDPDAHNRIATVIHASRRRDETMTLIGVLGFLITTAEQTLVELAGAKGTTAQDELQRIALMIAEHRAGLS
jgi:hypothetical protein